VRLNPIDIKKILVIKLRAIGDVLLSTVVLRNLRAAYPDAQIDFLTEVLSRNVVEGNPDVDSVVAFDNKNQSGIDLILSVRRRKYDLILDLFGNPRSALVTYLSGARYRVGYRFKWRQYCYTVVVNPRGGEVHNTEFNLDALRAVGVPIVESSTCFPIDRSADSFAQRFFQEHCLLGKFVVALNHGGGWISKRWRIPQFSALGDLVAERYDAKILVIWGPGERSAAEQIQRSMNAKAILIPPCDLKQLAAILRHSSAVITNDSGPMHIAAAVGTPVVAIFGPTRPELQGPVGAVAEIVRNERLLCLGCNYTECPIGNPCMEELAVNTVFAAFQRLMIKRNSQLPHQHNETEAPKNKIC